MQIHPLRTALAIAAALTLAGCGSSDAPNIVVGSDPTPESVGLSLGDGDAESGSEGPGEGEGEVAAVGEGPTQLPEPVGAVEPFVLDEGGMTLQVDTGFWQREEFSSGETGGLSWFKNAETGAIVQVSFDVGEREPSGVCEPDYDGNFDPERHTVTLLHEDQLANGVARVFEADRDWRGDDPAVGISYIYFTGGAVDGPAIGETYCSEIGPLAWTSVTRSDGEPVKYNIQAFFAFTVDFPNAPFKEDFASIDEMRSRPGFAEMIALLDSIKIATAAG